MTVRVAISSFDPDCGDDAHGVAMTKAYAEHTRALSIMLGARSPRATSYRVPVGRAFNPRTGEIK